MFLLSSATRVEASFAARSRATFSSLALAWTLPLDSVSLSGVAATGFFSSTEACSRPLACRWAASIRLAGTPSASLRRNSLKSRLCATTVWLASAAEIALAWSAPGISRTAPALSRLTLPPPNASGLARSIATSIWSSETVVGLFAPAIALAVSPARTVTCFELAEAADLGVAVDGAEGVFGAAAGRGAGAVRATAAGGDVPKRGTWVEETAGGGATGETWAASGGGAFWRRLCGSNSKV